MRIGIRVQNASECLGLVSDVLCQFLEPDSSMTLCWPMCISGITKEVLVYSLIDEAIRFHVTQVVPLQSARDLYEAIMNAWVKWAGAPRFLLVDPHRSHLARQFIEQLGAQGTTVLVGAAKASWTRGLVECHGAYVRSMVEKMVHDGVPEDISA